MLSPTPYPDINALLQDLLGRIQAILGTHFIGMYLEGSLAHGGFDQDSDIDFIVATDEEVTPEQFAPLQAMHDQVNALENPWAVQLEGSYISLPALRRHDPAHAFHPNIERGEGERLKMTEHDYGGVVHRSILYEHGITLVGPAPQALVDPVSADDLRYAVRETLPVWGGRLLTDPALLRHHGYRCYAVLTICRMLYTLQHGAVVSKGVAAAWARDALGPRWTNLIDRAWTGRSNPGDDTPEDVSDTAEFLKYAFEKIKD